MIHQKATHRNLPFQSFLARLSALLKMNFLMCACAASWGGLKLIDGVGWEADGAEAELYDIDLDGQLELFLMAYDDPWGGNTFRYRVVDP